MKAGLAAFVALVAALHVLRADELPPSQHFISEYARGELAPVMVLAFGCWAASLALLAVRWRGVVRWALVLAAAGAAVAGAFPTETVAGELPPGVERTLGGRLHDLATLLVLAGLLAAAAASAWVVHRRGFRLAVLGLAAALVAVVPVLVALGVDAPGLGQRAFVLIGVGWQALAVREVA